MALDVAIWEVRNFFGTELPELLALSANALKKAPWPGTVDEIFSLTRDDFFQLLPIACAVCSAAAMLLLQGRQATNSTMTNSYWLVRVLLLRGMALVYLSGFLSFAFQARAMRWMGFQPEMHAAGNERWILLEHDWALETVSWVGVFLSLLLLTSECTCALLMGLLWCLYLSLLTSSAASPAEWLTLELGFLSIWLCPLLTVWRSPFPRHFAPPPLILFLFRWCAFRVDLGAGMAKLGRSAATCWRQSTCAQRFETQPMPSPLSWYAHHLPSHIEELETSALLLEQLVLPFLFFLPLRSLRVAAALLALASHLRYAAALRNYALQVLSLLAHIPVS